MLSCVPCSVGFRTMEVVVSKMQQCSDSPFKANPCTRGSASPVGMFWRHSAPCRVMPPGSSPWHRACSSYTFTRVFIALYLSADLRGSQAASPQALPKGLLSWGCVWKWDQRAKGKGHQPALACAQNTGCPGQWQWGQGVKAA